MAHSNSSLNCFANCMAKYNYNYILHTDPCKPPSPHLVFGAMAHEVLYKAGKLRDEYYDGVINPDEYESVIPSEVLYPDLKDEFKIPNWHEYFVPVIKQVAQYENEFINQFTSNNEQVQIDREIKLELTPLQLSNMGYHGIHQPIVGIIDCLIRTPTKAIIFDFKFSSTRKTQDDFDQNSQLPLYALFVNILYNIPLHNIQVGYIDIPKQSFSKPLTLTNGTLSRAKSQNVSAELYKQAVLETHGADPYYNCDEGGYYNEIYNCLMLNKAAYLSYQYLDYDIYVHIIEDLMTAARMIDKFAELKFPYLRKYDSYSCKGCEYLEICKPWLGVNNYE